MSLPLLGELVGGGAVAAVVGLVCAVEAGLAGAALLAGEVAQAVVLGFCGGGGGGVVEGWVWELSVRGVQACVGALVGLCVVCAIADGGEAYLESLIGWRGRTCWINCVL